MRTDKAIARYLGMHKTAGIGSQITKLLGLGAKEEIIGAKGLVGTKPAVGTTKWPRPVKSILTPSEEANRISENARIYDALQDTKKSPFFFWNSVEESPSGVREYISRSNNAKRYQRPSDAKDLKKQLQERPGGANVPGGESGSRLLKSPSDKPKYNAKDEWVEPLPAGESVGPVSKYEVPASENATDWIGDW